jgi:hypothetical protein
MKKSKFELQRVGTEVASDLHARLEAMTLAKRIAALAVDVESKRDEYRLIDPHEPASLLGIDDADKPGGNWKYLKTPYDKRDGAFDSLSKYVIVENRP